MKLVSRKIATALVASFGLCAQAVAAPNEQFIPVTVFKTGPISGMGMRLFGGLIDYLDLVNKRDGGVGGVKLTWEECESAFQIDRAVECYERTKKKGPTGASLYVGYHTGSIYALAERTAVDKIPIAHLNAGPVQASDGRVFPYIFPIGTSYWSGATGVVAYIGSREGGTDRLKGKNIVNLHMGNAYGKEPIPILEVAAKKYGFSLTHIEVPLPGIEQQSQWLQIRQIKPDWIILQTAGAQVTSALKMAQRTGFPADHIVGLYGAGAEEDVIPAGDAAKGYVAWGMAPAGVDFPVIRDIKKFLYQGNSRGNMKDPDSIGAITYNGGVVTGILHTEAIRTAQGKFGRKPLTGEQIRWGFEHLEINEKLLKALGAVGLVPPLKLSCADHEGGAPIKFHEWDGKKFTVVTDWVPTDQSIVRPLIEEAAAKYAKEKGITPRDCSKEG